MTDEATHSFLFCFSLTGVEYQIILIDTGLLFDESNK
jgi:hypothetical protein